MSEATLGSKLYVGGIGAWSLAATVVVLGAMVATTPTAAGPFLVTGWFIVTLIALTGWFTLAFYGLSRKFGASTGMSSVQLKVALRRGFLLGLWLVLLMGMSSLGQLGMRDVVLSAILLVLVELYLRAKL